MNNMIVLCCLCIFAHVTAENSLPTKVAVWTHDNSNIISKSEYKTQTIEMDSFLNNFEESTKTAEVVAFLKSSDGRPILSHTSVVGSIQKSGASTIMSNVYRSHGNIDGQATANDQLAHANLLRNAPTVTLQGLHEHLSKTGSMTNGKVDAVIVTLAGDPSEHESLQTIVSLASPQHPITFVAVHEPHTFAMAPTQTSQYSRILTSTATSNVIDGIYYKPEGAEYSIYYADTYLYITPDIFTALMTGIFMFFVVLTGLSCMNAIQGSSSFVHKVPPVGKEC